MGKIYLKKVKTYQTMIPRCHNCYYKNHSDEKCLRVCNKNYYYVRLTPDELRERGTIEEKENI